MTDSMKFGPEWLRTLSESGPLGLNCSPTGSSHSTGGGSVPPGHSPQSCSIQSVRYTLAEHRYGREEMLALYNGTLSPPDSLKTLTGLFVEKSQQPLALFSFTDDELRIWNRGVNPDGLGRGGTGKGQTEGSMRGRRDGTGREGRGRGRGGGTPGNYYPRPPGAGVNSQGMPPYPQGESGDTNPEMCQQSTFNRNRTPFERQGDRSWSERNGGGGDGGGRGRIGGGDTNWRRHRGDEDPSNDSASLSGNNNSPGWRPQSKWQHQSRSWRDEDSWTDRDPRMSNHHLPEWAMEKNEGGGSFDASGAFHGHDQEDEIPFKRRDSRHLHDHHKSKSESSDVGDSGGGGLSDGSTERIHEPPEKDSSHSQSTNSNDTDREMSRDEETSPSLGLDEIKKHVEKLERLKGDQQAMELSEIKRQLHLLQKQQEQSVKLQQVSTEPNISSKDVVSQQVTESQSQQIPHQSAGVSQQMAPPLPSQVPLPTSPQPPPVLTQQLANTQQSPTLVQSQQGGGMLQQPQPATSQSMVTNQQVSASPGVIQPVQKQPAMVQQPVSTMQHVHQPLNSLARLHHQPPPPILNDSHLDDVSDNIATDLVAKLMEEEEKRDKQWYYKDPQGHVQGPFSCGEMAEWFQSGYFTLGLMVKRACDPSFSPLGELIKIWGCIPFLGDQPGAAQQGVIGQNIQEKERSPPQVQTAPGQVNQQLQDVMMHMKMDHFRHQQHLLLRQQQHQQAQASMAGRNQVKMPASDWPDHLPQQDTEGGEQASVQLRALLHQMQAHQQLKQQQQSTKGKESGGNSGGGGGGGAVMETLMSLHQQQVAQQAALQQLQQAAQLAEGAAGAASIRTLVSQMQQGKLRVNNQQPNVDSVWNGGSSWKQWSQVNPKTFKTEQQVLEEQMRAEDDRKRDEIRKQEEAVRLSEDDTKDRKREKHEEKVHNERNKRESDDIQRRRIEEEEIRRKQEAARRAEVERQRKEEDKRKKEEEKRRKDEEKRKQLEERERLKLDEHRKKKEAEEAKKRQQDLMSKIQRAQWAPPQASNTSLLEIQRSEREQQVLRSMRDQQAQEAAAAAAAEQAKTNLHLKWTETNRCPPSVESLADIQAQQYRQFIKVQEKEKAEREKKEAAAAAANQQVSGTWSQGLNWGSSHPQPGWHSNQGGGGGLVGFWDQLAGPKPVQAPTNPVVSKTTPVGVGKPPGVVGNPVPHQQQQQQQVTKENKSKAKREEMALLQLFGTQNRPDEFTQWCQQTLANLPMSCPLDIPTFVSFLRDIESGPDVVDYVRGYVGESKEAMDFARQFLERRHTLQQQGVISQQNMAVGHQPPMSHHSNQDFQQVKSKGKNKKKARVAKAVDPRILGFSSTASPDRINVGDREYPEDL